MNPVTEKTTIAATPKETRLDKYIAVDAGRVQGRVYGGPFREYIPGTRRLVGVKMAEEIDHPHDISIPTRDFGVPAKKDLTRGLLETLTRVSEGNDVYVGCMAGRGRTGLFMAVLTKALMQYNGTLKEPFDSILSVRENYNPHAVETPDQIEYVQNFNVEPVVQLLHKLNGEKYNGGKVKRVYEKPTTLGVTISFLSALQSFLPHLINVLKVVQRRFDKR